MLAGDDLHGNQKTLIYVSAVDRKKLDFVLSICSPDIAIGRAARGTHADHNDVAVTSQASPLALHPPDPPGDVECQVDSTVLGNRLEDRDSELQGLKHDRLLGDRSFGIRIHLANTCSHAGRMELLVRHGFWQRVGLGTLPPCVARTGRWLSSVCWARWLCSASACGASFTPSRAARARAAPSSSPQRRPIPRARIRPTPRPSVSTTLVTLPACTTAPLTPDV